MGVEVGFFVNGNYWCGVLNNIGKYMLCFLFVKKFVEKKFYCFDFVLED